MICPQRVQAQSYILLHEHGFLYSLIRLDGVPGRLGGIHSLLAITVRIGQSQSSWTYVLEKAASQREDAREECQNGIYISCWSEVTSMITLPFGLSHPYCSCSCLSFCSGETASKRYLVVGCGTASSKASTAHIEQRRGGFDHEKAMGGGNEHRQVRLDKKQLSPCRAGGVQRLCPSFRSTSEGEPSRVRDTLGHFGIGGAGARFSYKL